ncbi:MAG: hypothetical protein K8F92_10275 [Hyphomicrobium sp.]|uniref:hypothetical protein n=1 Tax=Hyphomicrobium sp. TaxID=82 RepID=UPI001322998A|nr:hypothetical protein [Hyphomicrobium sp.]KAB2941743.1 MAG: hypothetical protein F9K20_08315 [Hyphomicrobium sp.]MBZ0210024.1 hypothetical protein [Hyphomicrobium sp.]
MRSGVKCLTFLTAALLPHAPSIRAQPLGAQPKMASEQSYERVEPPIPRPDLIKPRPSEWPFVPWSYAKAYTFNFFPQYAQPEVVTKNGIWSKYIRSEQLVMRAQAIAAGELVAAIQGSFEDSKCMLPRHALVYFDRDDRPIASVNVCFECEGVLAWPDYEAKNEDRYLDETFRKTFEEAIAGFRVLFKQEFGQPTNYRDDPRPGPGT